MHQPSPPSSPAGRDLLLRLALGEARIGTWQWSAGQATLRLSPECLALAGQDPEAPLTPADGLRRVHPEDRERVASALTAAVGSRRAAASVEFRLQRGDGTIARVSVAGSFDYTAEGALLRAEGIVREPTGRQPAGESVALGRDPHDARAVRRSEARWRQMAEAMPQLVWTCTPGGPCDYLSPQWTEYTGRPAREQLGYGWLELVHPDDRERILATWQRALHSGYFDAEYRIRRHDGAWRWFKARAVPARDPDGHVTRWYGSSTDIHDLRTAEEAVREADRRKTEFLATLSHELRNPLAPSVTRSSCSSAATRTAGSRHRGR